MTIAFDTSTVKGSTTGDSTWSHTAGASGIDAVIVYIIQRATNTPPIGVTYGGTAMTKFSEANDTATETGNTTAWILRSPAQGTQTVSVDVGAAAVWIGTALTYTSDNGTSVYFAVQQENAANPSITVTVPASYVNISSGGYFTGATAPIGAGTNYTAFGGVDFGNDAGEGLRLTTGTTTGNPTVATAAAASDDLAFVAVAIGQSILLTDSVDSLLKKTQRSVSSVDARLSKPIVSSIDSALKQTIRTTYPLESLILKTQRSTSSEDSLAKKTQTLSSSVDSVVLLRSQISSSVDSDIASAADTTVESDVLAIIVQRLRSSSSESGKDELNVSIANSGGTLGYAFDLVVPEPRHSIFTTPVGVDSLLV